MPTEDEIQSIIEARKNDPDLPLGTAEEFLYTLSNVPQLESRLRLWKFNYSFRAFEEVKILCLHFLHMYSQTPF